MTVAERKRKAHEILTLAGLNNSAQVAVNTSTLTFREAAEEFITQAQDPMRRRGPVKGATLCTWNSALRSNLNPYFGEMLLSSIDDEAVKAFIASLREKKLSAKTIVDQMGLATEIIRSVRDKKRQQLFAAKWDLEYVKLPIVKPSEQKRVSVTKESVEQLIARSSGNERMLYALLAGTGLRVGEALGLRIENISHRLPHDLRTREPMEYHDSDAQNTGSHSGC